MAKTYRFGSGTRLVNRFAGLMARLGLGARHVYILTVRGRKTGRLYSVPVDVMELDGHKALVAPYGPVNWVRNVRASGEVTLRRGSHSERFGVQEAGAEEGVSVLRKYLSEVPITRPYFDAGLDSTDEAIAAELPRHPVFRLVPQA